MNYLNWKSYPSWFMFSTTLSMGILMIMSSDNWFMSWVGLELSLLGFVPMLVSNSLSIEGAIKYFLIQAGGSILLILSFMNHSVYAELIYVLSMAIKLGLAPFYQWVPSVVSSTNLFNILILLIVQKMGPLVMMMKVSSATFNLLVTLSTLSILAGALGGMSQTQMIPLLSYSSIAHTGWVVLSLIVSTTLCMSYFLLYSLSLTGLLLTIWSSSTYKIYKMSSQTYNQTTTSMLMLNMSGMPPLPLFFGKMLIIYHMVFAYTLPTLVIVMLSSLTIYMYLYNIIPTSNLNLKMTWTKK